MSAQKKVFIVQGIHPHVPGCPMTAHATKTSANAGAAALASRILQSAGRMPCDPKSWRLRIEGYAKELSEADTDTQCDVWISELPIKQ